MATVPTEFPIECVDLGRVYSSRKLFGPSQSKVAIEGLSLQVPKGIVFGLLGPNGAGKTTVVRILSTLLTPTSGEARVLGMDVVKDAHKVRQRIGLVLGGERGLYGRLTGMENLLYFAGLNQLRPSVAKKRANKYLSMLGLSDRADSPVSQYSRGMKQRLHLARGLLTEPSVIFLDEPTIGLDPEAALDFRKMIPELASTGVTILVTTHNMPEAEQICDRVTIINRKLMAMGTPDEIKRSASGVTIMEIGVSAPSESLLDKLTLMDGVLRVEPHRNIEGVDPRIDRLTIHLSKIDNSGENIDEPIMELLSEVTTGPPSHRDPTLEECYLAILRRGSKGAAA